MLPTVRRTWAPRGQTPILRHRTRHHRKVSAMGALTLSPQRRRLGLYLHWYPNANINQGAVVLFLRYLLTHLRGQVVLLWDRLNAHRGQEVRALQAVYPRLTVEYFPPYAPEFNPIEHLWGYLKHHRMANHGIYELEELQECVEGETEVVRGKRSLLRSFVHASELPIRLR